MHKYIYIFLDLIDRLSYLHLLPRLSLSPLPLKSARSLKIYRPSALALDPQHVPYSLEWVPFDMYVYGSL